VSGIEVATDIWWRAETCSYSNGIKESPVDLDTESDDGRWFMMTGAGGAADPVASGRMQGWGEGLRQAASTSTRTGGRDPSRSAL
jgi:hypothetical protein